MSARSEATNLIKVGYSPSEVAEELGKTKRIAELIRLIVTSVGEGDLLLSEIYFSIPESRRQLYERIYEKYPERDFRSLQMEPIYEMFSSGKDDPIVRKQMTLGPDYGNIELKLYWLAKDSPHTDTYRFLRDLEMTLHRLIRKTLELSFPAHDDGTHRYHHFIVRETSKTKVYK